MIKKIAIACFLLFFAGLVNAQEQKSYQQAVEDLVEELVSTSDQEQDYSSVVEELLFFAENPLNINSATLEDFEKLVMLTDFQVKSLLAYRDNSGELATIYELQLVPGFDFPTIKKMLPFVTVAPVQLSQALELKKALKYSRNELMARTSGNIERADGYAAISDSVRNANPSKYYPGNRMRVYTQYKYSFQNKLLMGITAEKDPGEEFFKGSQTNGFDYYSAFLQLNDVGIIQSAVLGDFQVQFGQGLVMGSYISMGKSSMVTGIRKKNMVLKKYSSTDENQYMRGAGVTLKLSNLTLTAFGSHKPMDANLQVSDTLTSDEEATSLQISGIHATPAQLADKSALTETAAGGNIKWRYKQFQLGVSGLASKYSTPLAVSNQPADVYKFSGTHNQNLGADFQFLFHSVHLFGEAALSSNKGKAALLGALLELNSQVSVSVLYRNYDKKFQALHGNAFAEGSKNQNEQGFYAGIQLFPVKKWKLSAYYDFYRFPRITSQSDGPSQGTDYLIQADFVANRMVSMYWRLKRELKETNGTTGTAEIAPLTQVDQANVRYQLNYSVNEKWRFKNRVEVSRYILEPNSPEYGYLLYQDVGCSPFRIPLSLTFRYAIYQTASYNTRIYTYESDVLNAFSVPALYDKGTRIYAMLQYEFSPNLECWLRYAQTYYADKTEIGSGMDQIAGNTKSEVKFQVRWKF